MSLEFNIQELAYRAMGKTEQEKEDALNNGDIDEAIYEKYDTDFETYCGIVRDLLPFTPLIEAGISGKSFHGFVDNAESRFIVKIPKS